MENDRREEKKGARSGCIVAGWLFFFIVAAVLGFFGYKVWYYYGQVSKGERIALPQFASHLTVVSGQASNPGAASVDRAVVESGGETSEAPASAPLTIVEFGDFECPYSKEAYTAVRRLMTKYGDKVRFVYRNFPIESIHPDAMLAAVAAECAGEQGAFWAYHDKLYLNAPALDFQNLVRYGNEVGLDGDAFEQCLISRSTETTVSNDIAAGETGGVRGTPTFFLNGYKIEGAIPEADLDRVIQDFLDRAP